MATETIFPVPGSHGDKPLTIYVNQPRADGARWSEIVDWAAWQFDCSTDDVDTHEVFFGGEYSDDDMREVLTIKGEIVGVFDRPCTTTEWSALFDAECYGDTHPMTGVVNYNRAA